MCFCTLVYFRVSIDFFCCFFSTSRFTNTRQLFSLSALCAERRRRERRRENSPPTPTPPTPPPPPPPPPPPLRVVHSSPLLFLLLSFFIYKIVCVCVCVCRPFAIWCRRSLHKFSHSLKEANTTTAPLIRRRRRT